MFITQSTVATDSRVININFFLKFLTYQISNSQCTIITHAYVFISICNKWLHNTIRSISSLAWINIYFFIATSVKTWPFIPFNTYRPLLTRSGNRKCYSVAKCLSIRHNLKYDVLKMWHIPAKIIWKWTRRLNLFRRSCCKHYTCSYNSHTHALTRTHIHTR